MLTFMGLDEISMRCVDIHNVQLAQQTVRQVCSKLHNSRDNFGPVPGTQVRVVLSSTPYHVSAFCALPVQGKATRHYASR